MNKNRICLIESCNHHHQAKGFCNMHYIRWKKYGNPNKKIRNSKGEGTLSHGYLRIQSKGKRVTVHRIIMEKFLGRKLKKSEVVHHINENKLDNRPENLQVMSKSEHQVIHHAKGFRDKTHKQCLSCKIIKPRWQFYRNYYPGKFRDKNHSYCKECNYLHSKAHPSNRSPQAR